ncbi:hypothetical protein E3P92_01798 [Wallemia ichthyophaga]|uniref:Transcription initiation factor TFIID subunit 4 n=2 Tax=Wallemia ichthyophaga TaxID=245174 RepID=A0A4T0IG55_WALIC|nr:Transcription initiation factor TFIID subunit 4 [Wallemia ichthyophaga EXF-994]TIA73109.1 hypothetical protein E3P91_01619 [Wallemia ichthyophaga]EOQ99042.1 Transcription initiation factor TFIID subunit 4 [Wallemia ichthyophaga EXF-994]TIA83907.1 hypothetical protein E3P98_00458 [Wallemia ichthyophaga]TIA90380.1 hypothetical protein E3P97_02567 [Wallemia ichthyophaga]TIB01174.1 hypothetical protein E3P95_01356 [Wallemia ichthyophaga]
MSTGQTEQSNKGTDVRSLIDAVGNAGVDIEAEHEAILQSNDILQSRYGLPTRHNRSRTQDFLNNSILRDKIRAAAAPHQLQRVDEDCLQFLALATQARLRHLIELMIQANHHRSASSHVNAPTIIHGDPLYSQSIRTDTDKQLQALEKIEREDETKARRERVERITVEREEKQFLQSQQQQQQLVEEDDQKKKKRKKDMSTAKNMSDDVQKKLSDQTALRSAGLAPKYSWLTGGAVPSPRSSSNLPKPKFQPQQSNLNIKTSQQKTLGPPPHDAHLESGTINLNDALFALERERGMGAGRGSGQMTAWKRYITSAPEEY